MDICLMKMKTKESPFKSIIEHIKRGLYYVEKTNNLSTSVIKNIKKIKFKNELFKNNNRIKKILMNIEIKSQIFIRLKK